MTRCAILCLLLVLSSTVCEECGYSLCPPTKDGHINVHLIPHTHDDVGWLKNIDQYYFGDASWYQTASVQYILDSVIQALLINPSRKFTYVEMAFFERWWRMQNSVMHEIVRGLVHSGQLEFALGGWSMNDEAVVHYSDSIDQLTRGLAFLNATFGDCGRPRVAWQIDPFGHAREQARIFLEAGFDGVFFQRMDFREKQKRLKSKRMEVLWRPDPTDNSSGFFTHMLFQGYCSPPGFCFDSKCNDPPMVVDPSATNYNVPSRVNQFLDFAHSVSRSYDTSHIFVPMGCDFTYENANENFINIDRLIEHVNHHQRQEMLPGKARKTSTKPLHLLYSSPACYTKAVNSDFNKKGTIPERHGDFFPYASGVNTYWTGFYTSRPAQKYMVRQASSLLAACEQAHLLKPSSGHRYRQSRRVAYDQPTKYFSSDEVVDQLRRIMGVMQHHDAVTGTEKQHVSDDYRFRLNDAIQGCQHLISSVADTFFSPLSSFRACEALNVSVCPPITRKDNLPDVIVAVYSPLGWVSHRPWIRLPLHATKEDVDARFAYTLTDYLTGETIPFQVVSLTAAVDSLPERTVLHEKGHSELVFKSNFGLLPAGFSLFALRGEPSHGYGFGYQPQKRRQRNSVSIGPDLLPVFKTSEGQTITMKLMNYEAWQFNQPTSGAYVFRALQDAVTIGNATSEIIEGELVTEVRTKFSAWASLTARLYVDDQMEVEWVVGPLPNIGRRVTEVIVRYSVSGPGLRPQTEGEFFTDSMGNGLIRRERAKHASKPRTTSSLGSTANPTDSPHTPHPHPIEASYFPVVNRIMLKGTEYAFAIYTDRPEGGSSLAEGELELMLHRATVVDDGLGVGEPLNERAFGEGLAVRGTHKLVLDTLRNIEALDPRLAQEVSRPPVFAFRDRAGESAGPPQSMSILHKGLPEDIHLLTVQRWPLDAASTQGQILVRLQHLGIPNCGPVTLNVADAFTIGRIGKVTELSLTANQLDSLSKANSLPWPTAKRRYLSGVNGTLVTIQPGEIKSLLLDLE